MLLLERYLLIIQHNSEEVFVNISKGGLKWARREALESSAPLVPLSSLHTVYLNIYRLYNAVMHLCMFPPLPLKQHGPRRFLLDRNTLNRNILLSCALLPVPGCAPCLTRCTFISSSSFFLVSGGGEGSKSVILKFMYEKALVLHLICSILHIIYNIYNSVYEFTLIFY